MKVYEMEIEFEVVVGLKDFNIFMNAMGFEEKAGVSGQSIILKQTIPFVPNEEYLKKVANIIKGEYETEKLEILDCKFKGYKKFLEKEI